MFVANGLGHSRAIGRCAARSFSRLCCLAEVRARARRLKQAQLAHQTFEAVVRFAARLAVALALHDAGRDATDLAD